ncbi:MAG: glycine cleavage system aminomethyltransferase GcvT [Myxococcota bacterium]
MSELSRTPLFETHRRLGARLVPFAGWEMPIQYSSILEEHAAVRERAGLFDVSHMGQIFFEGPDALAAVDALVTSDVASLAIGRARYGLLLNDAGGCVDDVIATRLGERELFLCVNASNIDKDREWILRHVSGDVRVDDRSASTALLALQGPASARILARFAGAELELPRRFGAARMKLAGLDLIVSATGYTGSPGFEIACANDAAERLFTGLLAAGEADGIKPVGLGARDTLRLEAGMALYGHELDDTTTPYEAGLERYVKDLARPFVGVEALRRLAGQPPARRLVGFELVERGIARADYEIVHEGRVVGRVTSGAPSPTLGKSIGLGYVPPALSAVGQALGIRIRGKDVAAQVVALPFLRPGR